MTDAYSHLPELQTDIFARYPRASYMVALAGAGGEVIMPEVFDACRELRFRKYSQLGWIALDNVEYKNGRQLEPFDEYDADAEHIAVIKNRKAKPPVLIATGRSLIKPTAEQPHPVEKAYPEIFAEAPAPVHSNEISRLVSDSKDRPERALASMAVQRAMTTRCIQKEYGPTYAMIEEYLAKRLRVTHFPHDLLADFKPIPQYADTQNAVMRTDWQRVLRETRLGAGQVPWRTSLFFKSVDRPGGGFGFYGKHFLHRFGPQPESEM